MTQKSGPTSVDKDVNMEQQVCSSKVNTSVLPLMFCSSHAVWHATRGAVCLLHAMSFKYRLAIKGLDPSENRIAEVDTTGDPAQQTCLQHCHNPSQSIQALTGL